VKITKSVVAIFLWSALWVTYLTGRDALAQQSPGNASDTLGEIIVTAQKRSESIKDVPMSINALTGAQLTAQGINDVGDLQKVVAGFHYTTAFDSTPIYYIRGIGFNTLTLGAPPNVSVYVDQVPLAFPVMTGGVGLDLERVEVLKGPQGTLFGQNATGGAVNYIAAKPTSTFASAVTVGYARFDDRTINGYVSGPLAESVNARLAFNDEQSGPWQQSTTADKELGRINKFNARLLLDWNPIDTLKVEFNINGLEDKSEPQANQWSGYHFLQGTPTMGPASFIPQPYQDLIQNYPRPGNNDRAADWGTTRPSQDNKLWQGSVRADYELPDHMNLTYIGSYASYTMDRVDDPAGVFFDDYNPTTVAAITSTTQELRIDGDALHDQLKWMIGGNYEKDNTEQTDTVDYSYNSNAYALVSALDNPAAYINTVGDAISQNFTNKSVFGSIDYHFDGPFVAHASVRHTTSDVAFAGCTRDAGDGVLAHAYNLLLGAPVIAPGGCTTVTPAGVFGVVHADLDQNNTPWRVGLDWKPNDRTLVYANVSKGYKGGSFPNLSATSSVQYKPVTQESVLASEIGFKIDFKEENVHLDGAVFHYDYDNKQVFGNVIVPIYGPLQALVNVPKSKVNGIEGQVLWSPLQGLSFSMNATYLQTKIEDGFTNYDDFGRLGNFGNEPFPNTPKWQGNLDAEYSWTIRNGMSPFIGASDEFQGDTYGGLGENVSEKIDAYSLLDLRAGIAAADGSWRVTVWGRNVADKYYWINQVHVTDTIVRIAGQPGTFGVTFNYRFR
jgi:iron complex outermembrane recepter protein